MTWAEKQGIALTYIQPGKPQQNAYVERYNRTVRHEWLDQYIIETIEEAQQISHANGSGPTTTTAPTWASAASHPP
jgi:transposase InsO family protein